MGACLAPEPHGPECGGPPATLAQRRVVNAAKQQGWAVEWHHRLLILLRETGRRIYLVQVLFKKDGRWDYALAFNRSRDFHNTLRVNPAAFGDESETTIVERQRDLLAHLKEPQ